jgi:hypothetical protein
LLPGLQFSLEGSLNNYDTETVDSAVKSGLIRVNLTKTLRQSQPYLGVGYGMDGEYLFDDRKTLPTTGGRYFALPLVTRETHVLTGIVRDDLTPTTHASLVAGWGIDRLGEQGPLVDLRLTEDISDQLEAGLRARYGREANNSANNATNVGAHLQYKF